MLLASELVIAAFDQGHEDPLDPLLLIKGGVAIEMRLRLRGRATKDIDATLVVAGDMEAVETIVARVLGAPILDGAVRFDVRGIRHQAKSVRFSVQVLWQEHVLSKLTLDVSPGEAGISSTDRDDIPLLGIGRALGIDHGTDVAKCLALRFQIAQKLHAVTDVAAAQDRARDLPDIILLYGFIDPKLRSAVRDACVNTFQNRAAQSWPPQVEAQPGWDRLYANAIDGLENFPYPTVGDAITEVSQIVSDIEQSG